ncbi:unnamed protein product, partial [Vitis vinifera]
MYGRAGLDRFKKAQSLEPFSVTVNSKTSQPAAPTAVAHPSQVTQLGGGQSTWLPPDWAIEPRPGVYYLEVLKDGEVLDRINLDKRRNIFGRQFASCDFVLDHQSVSRQHAAVIPHKNGSIYVIDLGSAHGTFVANERLTKETPVELEVGQSLRFAASTRSYILRKNNEALFPPPPLPSEVNLPPPPDPSDEEAVLAYNTTLNRYGLSKSDLLPKSIEEQLSELRKQEWPSGIKLGESWLKLLGFQMVQKSYSCLYFFFLGMFFFLELSLFGIITRQKSYSCLLFLLSYLIFVIEYCMRSIQVQRLSSAASFSQIYLWITFQEPQKVKQVNKSVLGFEVF